VKQLKLSPRPIPPCSSKFNVGLVQGIPTESSILGIKLVKGTVQKVSNFAHYREFKSKAFTCPVCRESVVLSVGYSTPIHIRRSYCNKCKAKFCLIFENDANWCEVCRSRNLECLQRFILLAEVVYG
jgi:hypothetical protein